MIGITYLIFDAPPSIVGSYEERLHYLKSVLSRDSKHIKLVSIMACMGKNHLMKLFKV
jgi:hypothetical protein